MHSLFDIMLGGGVMLKYMENIYEIKQKRKNICYVKNGVMYGKWAFPTANAGWTVTYADKVNKKVLKEILIETQNYKTNLSSPQESLHEKYPDNLEFMKKVIVYDLEKKTPFETSEKLTLKTISTKEDLMHWSIIASKIYNECDADFLYESFKMDIGKKHATYFIFYKGNKPAGISQVIRGAGYSAVYWVGVLDEYRKQGYGTELVKQSLNYEIDHKRNKFMLTASELGLIIYKKLGFKPMDVYYQYSIKRK